MGKRRVQGMPKSNTICIYIANKTKLSENKKQRNVISHMIRKYNCTAEGRMHTCTEGHRGLELSEMN
jgi:hypothetical protein